MELRHGFAALLLALACLGCGGREDASPVPEGRMTDLLVDLHLAHARTEVVGPDSTRQVDSVLSRHGVSREEFDAAMRFYARHPEAYVALLDSVVDQMRMRRPSADTEGRDPLYQRPFASAFRDTLADLMDRAP